MKLIEKSKKSSGLSLWTKIVAVYLSISIPSIGLAENIVDNKVLPPGSFAVVEDPEILSQIGLPNGPAWCYDVNANAVIITAPARERAHCELKLMYELEKQKIKLNFEIDKLKVRVDTLLKQHDEILQIKDQEIDRLTKAALKRPNDYSYWWAAGGLISGVLLTLAAVAVAN